MTGWMRRHGLAFPSYKFHPDPPNPTTPTYYRILLVITVIMPVTAMMIVIVVIYIIPVPIKLLITNASRNVTSTHQLLTPYYRRVI